METVAAFRKFQDGLSRLSELTLDEIRELSVKDIQVLSDNIFLSRKQWNENQQVKQALLQKFLSVQTDPAAIVAAAIELKEYVLLSKHSDKVLETLMDASTSLHQVAPVAKARIEWSPTEIAKLPQSFLDYMADDFEKPNWIKHANDQEEAAEDESISSLFRSNNPQANYAERFWIKVLMYRTDVDPAVIFPCYMRHVDPRLMHVPFKVVKFESTTGDLLDQIDEYYGTGATLSPMITCRRNVQLLRDNLPNTLTPYAELSEGINWYAKTVYIEAPYASYLCPTRVEADVGRGSDLHVRCLTEYVQIRPGKEGHTSSTSYLDHQTLCVDKDKITGTSPCTAIAVDCGTWTHVKAIRVSGQAISII